MQRSLSEALNCLRPGFAKARQQKLAKRRDEIHVVLELRDVRNDKRARLPHGNSIFLHFSGEAQGRKYVIGEMVTILGCVRSYALEGGASSLPSQLRVILQ